MRYSSLARPVDFRIWTNAVVVVAALVAVVGGTLYEVWQHQPLQDGLQKGIALGGSVFLGWALARELDPDHDVSGLVAGGLAAVGYFVWGGPHFAWLILLLLCLRIINRITGLPMRRTDVLLAVLAGLWVLYRGEWMAGLLLALAFQNNSRLPDPQPEHRWWAMGSVALGLLSLFLFPLVGGISNDFPMGTILTAVVATVLFVPLIMRSREVISRCDATATPLHPARLRAARTSALLICMLMLIWYGQAGFVHLLPTWAAMAGTGLWGIFTAYRPDAGHLAR
ncbi:hypothetical protein SAMN05421823_108164 [Catalinimonas alkaloidigena]|uniref:Uncharacterized protein n=1 Tax=Catalinimonas alkaloidigena TaxID=1075417 RepID=A0A1G9N389_9BACT|nr:hypothetical protein [Catalinimonas alkaloidigena]SDL80844.1 hypothetical protein SAMN05421823_108164 [Catalinimonas alkaloidigena]